ncbi:hypothetical protein [Streptomyces sp. NBC_00076]|uniref:hypothetical protein n=1 Tax=Streptomyces sp. NBC_00076 TaxID=2975642 RepID=UPI00386B2A40
MTDAMTGPGAEGAPRDGKPRGRATRPATPPGLDPAKDAPSTAPHAERPEGPTTAIRDKARGTSPVEPDTRTREADAARGATTADRDTARGSDTARGGMGSGADTAPGEAGGVGGPGGFGGETAAGRDSSPGRAGSPGPAVTRDQADAAHGDRTGTRGEPDGIRGREAHDGSGALGASDAGAGGHGSRLLPRDECDKLSEQLQHAVAGFVDGPRDSVAEADHVLEEAAARFTEAVTQRRRTLRGAWQSTDGGDAGKPATSTDTEQLRLALRDYRELADRLLRL